MYNKDVNAKQYSFETNKIIEIKTTYTNTPDTSNKEIHLNIKWSPVV